MTSCIPRERRERPPEGYSVRVYDEDAESWRFSGMSDPITAAEVAESILVPGQHARIYNPAGEEVGRVYPGD